MEFTPELPRKKTKDLRIVPKLSGPAPSLEESFKPPVESHKQLHEIRLALSEENKVSGENGNSLNGRKTNGFEPFVNPEPTSNPLFINGYIGNFAQQMELNRKDIERVLKIAHLDGKVVLTSFASSRKPSTEAQGEQLVAKRSLFFGEKIKEDEKNNPYRRVVPTSEGWRIEINDTRIIEELEKKKPKEEKLKRDFVKQFNEQLKQGIWGCVWRERLAGAKDNDKLIPLAKTFMSLLEPAYTFGLYVINPALLSGLKLLASNFIYWGLINLLTKVGKAPRGRNFDNILEYFMPPVEIDKAARVFSYLSLKGNTLVREKKEEK